MIKPKKTDFCAICGDEFIKYKTTDRVCSWYCANDYKETKEKRKVLKEKVKKNGQPLTVQALVNLCQIIFNKYVRTRDVGKSCVSCLKPYQKNFQAGHLHPAGNCWKTRFNEKNVFGQCPECNETKNANLEEYRINVLLRISEEELEELDQLAKQNAEFSRDYLNELIQVYKAKTEKLEKKTN